MEDNSRDIEKREARHKRRVKNQIICYSVLAVFLIAIIAGGVVGGIRISRHISERRQAEELQEQLEALATQESQEIVVSEPETLETETEAETEDPLDSVLNSMISEMPLEDKVAGLFFITPEALTGVDQVTRAGNGTETALTEHAIGGLYYNSKNIQSEDKIKEMLSATVNMSKYRMFYGIEELGGTDHSEAAKAKIGEAQSSPAELGEAGDTAAAEDAGKTIGTTLAGLGFNLNMGPVADVLSNTENTLVKDISYGSNAETTASMVSSMVTGLKEGGVSTCLKYFPGLGGLSEDPSAGMASNDRTKEQLEAEEFTVYQAGIEAGTDMILVGNISCPALTGDNTPASVSDTVITDVLRTQLGYDGIVLAGPMTDAAITEYYGTDEAAIKAINAGADMIFSPEDFKAAYDGLLKAVQDGSISEERINESLLRIYRIKYADKVE